ncbi:MAG: alkaline phosphatase family protein, partial [Anaerolineales bacterium]|nr:alkaline phosphatase family protein [Anaerolineales bacterium]
MSHIKPVSLILLFLLLISSVSSLAAADETPKLVLLVVIDQVRADYLDRSGDNFTGGLKWLMDNGKNFTEAHHAHAITSTGVGHAALGTGYYPRNNGIIGNSWYRNEGSESINCVADSSVHAVTTAADFKGTPRSSSNLQVNGLADWIESADPESKTYGISRKDRGAILPAGKNPDGAFWYDYDNGQFISSTHYFKELPAWLNEFNREGYPGSYFGKLWEMSESGKSLLTRDDVVQSNYGWFSNQLPHSLGSAYPFPDSSFY